MNLIKRFIVISSIFSLFLTNPGGFFFAAVLAEETHASSSASSDSAFRDDEQTPANLQKQALVDSAITSLITQAEHTLQGKKQPAKMRTLKKKNFKPTENIPLTIDNEKADNLNVEVFNVDGEKVDVEVEELTTTSPAVLLIEPPTDFKPGRYRVKVTDTAGNVSMQDFTWGVLAINTHKTIYQQQDEAKIQMAVLDEAGKMVCDAKVSLTIQAPDGKIQTFATENKTITVNPDCYQKIYTPIPDFEVNYRINNGEGIYTMTLTAETKNGAYTITDTFQAKQQVPFDVERQANTRIFPPIHYPVTFSITANEDFTGEISEVVPSSFKILPIEGFEPFQVMNRDSKSATEQQDGHLTVPFTEYHEMTQGFGEEETDPLMAAKYHKYGLVGHDGLDYAVPMGTPILAADDGMVVTAKEEGDYGTTVVIQHSWGKSYYGHLSKIEKAQGANVSKGEIIGLSGNTGLSTGPHLHFGIKFNENDTDNGYFGKVNPLPYFATNPQQVAGIATSSAILRNEPDEEDTQVLIWNVSMKKGEKIELGYQYLAPLESPQFYTIGPLAFYEQKNVTPTIEQHNASASATASLSATLSPTPPLAATSSSSLIFKETRKWQIAADDMGTGTRAAPTLSDYQQSDWTDIVNTAEVTPSITWVAGNTIYVVGATEDETKTLQTPTATGLTFSLFTSTAGSSNARTYLWTATAASAGSSAVTADAGEASTAVRGIAAFVYNRSDGIGTTNTLTGSTAKTISLTRSQANSGVIVLLADWNAVNDTTVDPTPAGGTQRIAANVTGILTSFLFNWGDQGAAGTTSYGITNHTGTVDMSGIVIEVKGCDATPAMNQLLRHGEWFSSCGINEPFTF